MKTKLSFLFVLSLSSHVFSQSTILFPSIEGDELKEKLIENYKTTYVLSYDNARDTLFLRIDRKGDSLTCIYTGYTVFIDTTQDPTTYVYNNYNFQTEHTYPQSKGAEDGNGNSDMHHLFPVWGSVNASRGNNPFGELYSFQTDKWWFKDTSFTEEPSDIGNKCSKIGKILGETFFEPGEDKKGDIARAVFYFYTMYKEDADLADSLFFLLQHENFYKWGYYDPPDSLEKARTFKIATYQEDKPNPYILDLSLARRAFPITVYKTSTGEKYHCAGCQYLSQSCISINLYNAIRQGLEPCSVCSPPYIPWSLYQQEELLSGDYRTLDEIRIFPNPARGYVYVDLAWVKKNSIELILYDLLGKCVQKETIKITPSQILCHVDLTGLKPGLYYVSIKTNTANETTKLVITQ